VARLGPQRLARADRRKDILATTGVHIGGTDYDQKLNLRRVMPLLGFRHIGPTGREVPSPTFVDLASWHLIHRMYAPKVIRHARELRVNYSDIRLHDRLMAVLEHRLGHLLASEVEQGKIRSSVSGETASIDLSAVETALVAAFGPEDMAQDLAPLLEQVVECAAECVNRAGLGSGGLDAIYLTGGSSALRPFQTVLQGRFPGVEMLEGDLFGGVASGLSYAGKR